MKDEIIDCLAYNGKVSIKCISSREIVEKARKLHDLSPTASAALGRLLTITSIMGYELKTEEASITNQIKGNGPIGKIVAVSDNIPNVKACITNPHADLPLNEFGKLDVGGAVGQDGYINVIKDIGLKDPYIGISPLTSGEIADDFTNYFVKSEQRQSAVALGVLVNKDGVKAAGGYLINPMPDSTEEEIAKVEQSIFKAGAISKMLDENLSLLEIAKKITGDEDVKVLEENITPIYECDCSKEHMSEGLAKIGKEELEDIINKDGKAELVCHFCNKKYEFSKEELEGVLKNIC